MEEKLLLAGEIWREASAAVGPISPATAALLDERIAACRERPHDVLATARVTENIRQLKECLVARQK